MKVTGLFATSIAFMVAALWFVSNQRPILAVYEAANDIALVKVEESELESIFFLGDIMLARDVERRLSWQAPGYAFLNLGFLKEAVAVVGNFEAAAPETHEPTPNMVMKFSVSRALLPILSTGGVTHVSLANNHTLDFGEDGYRHTIEALRSSGLEAFGHPTRIDEDSIAYVQVGDKTLALVGINATYGDISDAWVERLETVMNTSDTQIVYIHWGQEYELSHSQTQEELARLFVDAGADIVIGHHPHVTQDVERYRNGLIFYSLGNFIFDQYWNDDVAEGLILELVIGDEESYVSLLPVESKTERVRPRLMSAEEKAGFLDKLAVRSSGVLAADIRRGRIPLQF